MSRSVSASIDDNRDLIVESPSETAMVLAARRDLAAFEPLYRLYVDRIYRYCLRRLDDPDRAADATSTIFIKAMQSISSCRPESFRSWLFSIAHNVTIDAYRTRRFDVDLEQAETVFNLDASPENIALRTESRLEIVALLDCLTVDQRQVVELRLAGLDGYEIAQALGRSRASVDTAQSRAVARIRKHLGIGIAHTTTEGRDVVA